MKKCENIDYQYFLKSYILQALKRTTPWSMYSCTHISNLYFRIPYRPACSISQQPRNAPGRCGHNGSASRLTFWRVRVWSSRVSWWVRRGGALSPGPAAAAARTESAPGSHSEGTGHLTSGPSGPKSQQKPQIVHWCETVTGHDLDRIRASMMLDAGT